MPAILVEAQFSYLLFQTSTSWPCPNSPCSSLSMCTCYDTSLHTLLFLQCSKNWVPGMPLMLRSLTWLHNVIVEPIRLEKDHSDGWKTSHVSQNISWDIRFERTLIWFILGWMNIHGRMKVISHTDELQLFNCNSTVLLCLLWLFLWWLGLYKRRGEMTGHNCSIVMVTGCWCKIWIWLCLLILYDYIFM